MKKLIISLMLIVLVSCNYTQTDNERKLGERIIICNSNSLNTNSFLTEYNSDGVLLNEIDFEGTGIYEIHKQLDFYILGSRFSNRIDIINMNEKRTIKSNKLPYDICVNGDNFFSVSGVNLNYGVLELYSNDEVEKTIELDGFLMQCSTVDNYVYVRSDIIDIEENEIESVLYIVDLIDFTLIKTILLDDIGQCKVMESFDHYTVIGNIFNGTDNIIIYDILNDKQITIDMNGENSSQNIIESIAIFEINSNIYHIDRSGMVTVINNNLEKIDSFIIEGEFIAASSYGKSLYLVDISKEEYQLLIYDLNHKAVRKIFDISNKENTVPHAIIVED